jgi:hypothetical protein
MGEEGDGVKDLSMSNGPLEALLKQRLIWSLTDAVSARDLIRHLAHAMGGCITASPTSLRPNC